MEIAVGWLRFTREIAPVSDAKRKARQRAGYTNIYVEVHLPSFVQALLSAGLINDAQIEDVAAIRDAAARAIRDWCRGGARLLRDLTAKEPPPKQNTYKPKPPPKPKHGPVRSTVGWTASDTVRWESGWRGDEASPTGGWEYIRGPSWCLSKPWSYTHVAKPAKKKRGKAVDLRGWKTDGQSITRFTPPGKNRK
jgi:hypothetical protein